MFVNVESNVANDKDHHHFGKTATQSQWGSSRSWVHEIARKRIDTEFEFVDMRLALDEAITPSQVKYSKDHTWATVRSQIK